MREFKLLNLSIFYKEDNELKLVKEDIIARRTIMGNYKEIITGIKFRPRNLNESVFANHSSVEVLNLGDSTFAELRSKEWSAHNYCVKAIKKYGFVFVLNKENNDFGNLRVARLSDASSYGKDFDYTKLYALSYTYNHTSKGYYKQDKKEIKKNYKKIKKELKKKK